MHTRTLGTNLEVAAVGLGCMGMSTAFRRRGRAARRNGTPLHGPQQQMIDR